MSSSVVAAPGRGEVELHDDVDDERLAVALLVGQDAVVAEGLDTAQVDAVGHRCAATSWRTANASRVPRRRGPGRPRHRRRRRPRWSRRWPRPGRRAGVGRRRRATPIRPRKVLREAPTSTGWPRARRASRWRQQGPVVRVRAWRTRARGRGRGVPRDAAGEQPSRRCGELGAYLGDDVVVDRPVCIRCCGPASASRRKGTPALGDQRHHVGVGEAAADVVDERRAGVERRGGDLGAHRVDDTTTPSSLRASTTGRTRRSSSSRWAARRPGGSTRRRRRRGRRPRRPARARARWPPPGSNQLPPSVNESGVTLTTPMSTGRPTAVGRPLWWPTACRSSTATEHERHRLGSGGGVAQLAADGAR